MKLTVRRIEPGEWESFGRLLVATYAELEGFPTVAEQPEYYAMLAAAGSFDARPLSQVWVAVDSDARLLGGVIYFAAMSAYGSGGSATSVAGASGIRLLAVDPAARGQGIGRRLTEACIEQARRHGHRQLVLHTTAAMQAAWKLYTSMGFTRSPDLDFMQGQLPVFGFRLQLDADPEVGRG